MSNLDALRLMVHFLQDSDLGVSAGIDDDARARAKNVLEWGVDEIARLRAEVLHLRAAATLTDAERDDLEVWMDVCARQRSGAIDGGCGELAERWGDREERSRRLMARLGGER